MHPGQPVPPPKIWRVYVQLTDELTEDEARAYMKDRKDNPDLYAENDQHHYIERFDGPVTIGRPRPYLPRG